MKDIFKLADRIFTGKRKKYSKSFKEILKIGNLNPDETIFIDDKLKYVKTANKLGIKGILFVDTKKLIKDLRKLNLL